MTATNRIDVHQHVLPPFWVQELLKKRPNQWIPDWSAEAAIDFMDSRHITKGFLSLTAPGISGWTDQERPDIARQVNDYTAALVTKWPNRFGHFATLPLPGVSAAITEIEYAFDTLAADGVVLLSNYGDQYLGNASFEPVWAELDKRAAIVHIHPGATSLPDIEGIPPPFVDFPFATTRTAVEMVLKGVLDRYSNVKVILSHGGGFLPYAAHRFAACASAAPGAPAQNALLEKFRRFYLDTALASSPFAVPSLAAFADPSRILFGTDFPYAPGGSAEAFTSALDESAVLSQAEHDAINHGNARAVFPRISSSA